MLAAPGRTGDSDKTTLTKQNACWQLHSYSRPLLQDSTLPRWCVLLTSKDHGKQGEADCKGPHVSKGRLADSYCVYHGNQHKRHHGLPPKEHACSCNLTNSKVCLALLMKVVKSYAVCMKFAHVRKLMKVEMTSGPQPDTQLCRQGDSNDRKTGLQTAGKATMEKKKWD